MKITQTAFVIATAISTADAFSFRGLFAKQHTVDTVDDNNDEAWDTIVNTNTHKDRALATIVATSTTTNANEGLPGCPETYETALGKGNIGFGSKVSVKEGGNTTVWECTGGDMGEVGAIFCGMLYYEPGEDKSLYGKLHWKSLGQCEGTISPTVTPVDPSDDEGLTPQGGCPQEFESVATQDNYNAGDKVSVDNVVYQCKYDAVPGPNCGQAGNEPGEPNGDTAWTKLGSCSGTISPTVAPTIDLLTDYPDGVPGCPAAYVKSGVYGLGDKASGSDIVGDGYSVVYKCKSDATGRCGQAGFEPGIPDGRNPAAWTSAWEEDGYCKGTISPTLSPSFDPLDVAAGCPETLTYPNTHVKGDKVSVNLPGDVEMVYECKVAGWCQMEGFEPGTIHDNLAWTKIGPCTGTFSPTPAPPPCSVTKKYKFGSCALGDTEVDVTLPAWYGTEDADIGVCQCIDIPKECPESEEGEDGCTCVKLHFNDAVIEEDGEVCSKPSKECKKLVASSSGDIEKQVAVLDYDESTTYEDGSVIRIHAQKYKCGVSGWCNIAAYAPNSSEDGIWKQAWSMDGFCPTTATTAPTTAPTGDSLTAAPTIDGLESAHIDDHEDINRVRYLRGE